MNNLESRIRSRLSEQGMTIQRLASESSVSEPTIHAILNRGDAKLSQLEKIAKALDTSLSFLLSDNAPSSFVPATSANQASSSQKVKADKNQSQQELLAALAACQRELEVTRALVAAKEETISLLRDSYNRLH